MPARLDKPLRRIGAVKTAKASIGGGLLLRSLRKMSRSPVRGIEVMPAEEASMT
jgi:hypothetical protein